MRVCYNILATFLKFKNFQYKTRGIKKASQVYEETRVSPGPQAPAFCHLDHSTRLLGIAKETPCQQGPEVWAAQPFSFQPKIQHIFQRKTGRNTEAFTGHFTCMFVSGNKPDNQLKLL